MSFGNQHHSFDEQPYLLKAMEFPLKDPRIVASSKADKEEPAPPPQLHKATRSTPPSLPHPIALFADLSAWLKWGERAWPNKYDPIFHSTNQHNPDRPLGPLNWAPEKERNYILLRHAFLTLHGAVTHAHNTILVNKMIPFSQMDRIVADCDDMLDLFRIPETRRDPKVLYKRSPPFLVNRGVGPALATGVFSNDDVIALEYLEKRLKPATAKVTAKFQKLIEHVESFTRITPVRRTKDTGTATVEHEEVVDSQAEIGEMSALVWENLLRVLEFAFVNYHRDVRKAMADFRLRLNARVAESAAA